MKKKINAPVQASDLREFHYMCLECKEAIFNPICPYCLTKEFKQWLKQYPKLEKKIIKNVKKFLKEHKSFSDNSYTCILCGDNSAYMCPYCFTEFLFNLLRTLNADNKILKEFYTLFNYDFECTGYCKEIKKIGIA